MESAVRIFIILASIIVIVLKDTFRLECCVNNMI